MSVPEIGFSCFTLELPWRNNAKNISCIPNRSYGAKTYVSRKFGRVYLLVDVADRTWILTHSGNLAGDIYKGLKSHSAGCILLGKFRGMIAGQAAVLYSKPTVYKFMELTNGKDLKINIQGVL